MTDVNLNTVLNDFVDRVPGVTHAVAISADGLLIACSRSLPRDEADRVAAIGSGLVSLLRGAARHLRAGAVVSNLTELSDGFLFTMSVSSGASLLAVADGDSDVGRVSYELTELLNRIDPVLMPYDRGIMPSALVS